MGCNISNRAQFAITQDPRKVTTQTTEPENIENTADLSPKSPKKKNKGEPIHNIKNVYITSSSFVGEKKGSITDTYKFISTLGIGHYGEVKLAEHKVAKFQRAVKIIKNTGLTHDEIQNSNHPNIIRVYEYYLDFKYIYIVCELCQGGELLDQIVLSQNLSEKRAANIFRQILLAINYCHNNKIIHRDLTPENIMFEAKQGDTVKLIDFGTSSIASTETRMMDNLGNCYYIAPEVFKKNYNEKCDIWSSGVILYIMICGYPPFQGRTEAEIFKAVTKGKILFEREDWNHASNEVKDLIKKMITVDPTKRLSAYECLEHPWLKTDEGTVFKPVFDRTLKNMQNFRSGRKIQIAVWNFLTSFLEFKEEKDALIKTFGALDLNKDGHLSREELLKGYLKLINPKQAEDEVNRIMDMVDIDNNGKIDFNEFMMATVSRHKVLSKEKLNTAFVMFDKDGNGTISLSEFKEIFCGENKIHDDVWKELISEIDENKDGTVNYQEFQKMLLKLLEMS